MTAKLVPSPSVLDNNVLVSSYIHEVERACHQARKNKERVVLTSVENKQTKVKNDVVEKKSISNTTFDIKSALLENRVVLYFQLIVPITDIAKAQAKDLYEVRVRLIDSGGNIIESGMTTEIIQQPDVSRVIDKWILREAIGRITRLVKAVKQSPVFTVRFTQESLTDADLMNWLVKLLNLQDLPERALVLEIREDVYLSNKKKAIPLMRYLHDTHNIKFMLSNVKDVETLEQCSERSHFDYIKLDKSLVEFIDKDAVVLNEIMLLNNLIRKQGSMSIVPRVDTAMLLTKVTECDPDFLQGYFINEPQQEIVHSNTIHLVESLKALG